MTSFNYSQGACVPRKYSVPLLVVCAAILFAPMGFAANCLNDPFAFADLPKTFDECDGNAQPLIVRITGIVPVQEGFIRLFEDDAMTKLSDRIFFQNSGHGDTIICFASDDEKVGLTECDPVLVKEEFLKGVEKGKPFEYVLALQNTVWKLKATITSDADETDKPGGSIKLSACSDEPTDFPRCTATPEPGTMALSGAVFGIIMLWRMRRS
ncbi:MAG TPA: PEP-CTERM sorting domain-containing protein [Bryobacteraceae bacterium]